ncbi:hypothetical protein BHE74_00009099 [Ensete ventricosum]|nr:hypothetical protein GW17_00019283 [Ensete ventricosum]RWW82444.1 hypothetical protein BHE74_00009099 [Ensete ventricosum]RZR98607.1 hypothetical protein BHM03_00027994 [Ensete ventricosum]
MVWYPVPSGILRGEKRQRLILRGETRRRLVLARGEEAPPCPVLPHPARGDDVASVLRGERRHRLIPRGEGGVASSRVGKEASPHPTRGDEVSHRPCARRLRFRRYSPVAGGSRTVSCRIGMYHLH